MKKLFSFLLAITVMLLSAFTCNFEFMPNVNALSQAKSGDVSSDGVIDGRDCAWLMQYIVGYNVSVDTSACDVNGDGKVNNKDYILLMRYLNGWDVELSQPDDDDVGIELPMDKW